jgi:hypothetical protein
MPVWMKRTVLAILIAVMISLMLAAHNGRGLLPFMSYSHGPFFIQPSLVDRKQLMLQTIVIILLFTLIANIPWRGKKT